MKKSSKTLQVFIDTFRIETQTMYRENGEINIYPCSFEENHFIVADGNRVSQKGRMVTQDDGTSKFHPYAVGSGSRYNNLYHSAHGTVRETKNDVVFQLRFHKRLGKGLIMDLLRKEVKEMVAFVKTRRDETQWAL